MIVAPRKKQSWKVGDVLLIPLLDGTSCVAQVVGREPSVLNSCSIALFDQLMRAQDQGTLPELNQEDVFSVLFVTPNFLDSGQWAVIGSQEVAIPRAMLPFEERRSTGFIGATVEGSKLVEDFLNAFYGMAIWDDWFDPNYLDELLISPEKKPVGRLILKKST